MNLGFHYHVPAAKKNGKIIVPGYLGVFIDSLADKVKNLHLFMHTPLSHEVQSLDYEIKNMNVYLHDLGPHTIMIKRWALQRVIIAKYRNIFEELDAVLLRIPTPMTYAFSSLIPYSKVFFLKVGDYGEGYYNLKMPVWKKAIMKVWTYIYQIQEKNAVLKINGFFTNSQVYFDKYKVLRTKIDLIKTTTISSDILFQKDYTTIDKNNLQLLYTGRMDLGKGLLQMVETLPKLLNAGITATMNFVGWEDNPDEPVKKVLADKAKKLGVSNRVVFHGKKKVGIELFSMYRNADIYIIASESEGFPRTIWEAMASSVPVIATKVGSIPYFLKDEQDALLIDSNSSDEIFKAIKKLIENDILRRDIIKSGFILAKENTLEKQAEKLTANIKLYLSSVNHT